MKFDIKSLIEQYYDTKRDQTIVSQYRFTPEEIEQLDGCKDRAEFCETATLILDNYLENVLHPVSEAHIRKLEAEMLASQKLGDR